MRPLPGEDVRDRRPSFAGDNDITPLAAPSFQPQQMTYFLADEKALEASQPQPSTNIPKSRDSPKNSTYGVESLETTMADSSDHEEKARKARRSWKKNLMQHMSPGSDDGLARSRSSSPRSSNDVSDTSRNASPSHQRRPSHATLSRPYTPSLFESPAPGSILNSPRSRRDSDAGSSLDDVTSQAIVSSGEEGERDAPPEMADSGSAPQLVMPSIKMPSRRPFTERGKNMGRLKVLIAGDSGIGKTSLIKAIVQSCEDIVHVDSLSLPPVSLPQSRRKSSKSRSRGADSTSTSQITEVYASTRAYPAWWSDLDDGRLLRRRKSMGDSVLERNLCFVDTPGYGTATSCLECINPVVEYIESQLKKFTAPGTPDSDLINMLSGGGGSQVDVVFYVLSHAVKPVDLEYMRRLSPFTNIIPIIGYADKISTEQLSTLKTAILSELDAADIRPFLFGSIPNDTSLPTAPWAVSTAIGKDTETMDASLLMSPDYVQPLVTSELSALVERVFNCDGISWLRHSAAKKFVQWRNESVPVNKPQCLYRPLGFNSSASSSLTAPVGATTSYALARITDHTQREERLAQIRLSNWAADLQRSLQNERRRFEELARSERAVWLTERLGECVQDGTIIPISEARPSSYSGASGMLVKQGTYSRAVRPENSLNPQDPLGLLQLNEDIKRRGLIALQVVSSFGIIGGLAYWMSRSWQAENGTFLWGLNWSEFSMVDWR